MTKSHIITTNPLYEYYTGFGKLGSGVVDFIQGCGLQISTLVAPSNVTQAIDHFKSSKENVTDAFKRLKFGMSQILLFQPVYSAIAIDPQDPESTKMRAIRIGTHVVDTLLALAGSIPLGLLVYASSSSMTPFFSSLSVYAILVLMLKKLEKGFEVKPENELPAAQNLSDKKGTVEIIDLSVAPASGEAKYKPVISQDVSRFIQHILAQYVIVSALMSSNNTVMYAILRMAFGMKAYKGGMVDSHVIEDMHGSVNTIAVFNPPEMMVAKVLGMGVLAPLSMGIADTLANLIIFRNTGNNKKEHKYAVLEGIKGVMVNGAKLLIPYAMGMHYAGFIAGGFAYGINHLLDTLTFKFPQNKEQVGDMFYSAGIYASLGMVLYPLLPIHMIGLSNVEACMLRMTAIAIVEAAAKYFVIPKMTSTKKFTLAEKVDMLALTLLAGAAIGFTLNAAVYTQDVMGLFHSITGEFGMPVLMPYVAFFLGSPLLKQLRKDNIISNSTFNVLYTAVIVISVMNTFSLFLKSKAWLIVQQWLESLGANYAFFAPLSEFLALYSAITGKAFLFDLTRALCLTLSVPLFMGIADRMTKLIDNTEIDKGDTSMSLTVLIRFICEVFKYFTRGALLVAFNAVSVHLQILAFAISGFCTGVLRGVIDAIGKDPKEFWNNIQTSKGVFVILIKGLILTFDQVAYLAQDLILDVFVPYLPISQSTASLISAVTISSLYLFTSVLIELSEEFVSDLLTSKNMKYAGQYTGMGDVEVNIGG